MTNVNDSLIECPQCKRQAESSYHQIWSRHIKCGGCGFNADLAMLGSPPAQPSEICLKKAEDIYRIAWKNGYFHGEANDPMDRVEEDIKDSEILKTCTTEPVSGDDGGGESDSLGEIPTASTKQPDGLSQVETVARAMFDVMKPRVDFNMPYAVTWEGIVDYGRDCYLRMAEAAMLTMQTEVSARPIEAPMKDGEKIGILIHDAIKTTLPKHMNVNRVFDAIKPYLRQPIKQDICSKHDNSWHGNCPECASAESKPESQSDECAEIDRRFCEAYSKASMREFPYQEVEVMHDAFAALLRIVREKIPSLESELQGSKRWGDTMQNERDYWHNMAESINTQPERETGEDADKAGYKRGFQDCERMVKEEPWRFRQDTDLAFKLSKAAEDVFMERKRQILSEGWSVEHDDKYLMDELPRAAACYATAHTDYRELSAWPWNVDWFKPSNARRNLIKAAALIIAEIERLDRKITHVEDGA